MAFDWIHFVQHHAIPHTTDGKNVKRGWLNVQCPFCGPADPSMHMGLDPATGGWACYRDPTHRGFSVPKMVKALLGVPWGKACELAGDWKEPSAVAWDDLAGQVRGLDAHTGGAVRPRVLAYPPEGCRTLKPAGATAIHARYLIRRDFDDADIPELVKLYHLQAGTSGKWRGRIILPFLNRKMKVEGWQGRAIGRHASLRYISHPDSSVVKNLLFNYGPAFHAERRRVLVVVEGPLDCLKVDFYGRGKGIRAVGTLGTSFTDRQVSCVYRLADRYERVLVLFDPGAEGAGLELCGRLAACRPTMGFLPDAIEDPGALYPDEVVPAIRACLD